MQIALLWYWKLEQLPDYKVDKDAESFWLFGPNSDDQKFRFLYSRYGQR